MKGSRSFCSLLILIVAATVVECHFEHFMHHNHKRSTTAAPGSTAESNEVSESLQNFYPGKDVMVDRNVVTGTDNEWRGATLGAGIIAAIVIGSIVVASCLCFCVVRCCSRKCSGERRGQVISMNIPTPRRQEAPPAQVIVQQVPVAFPTYPAQPYTGQVNPTMQHYPPEQLQHGQYTQQSAPSGEPKKFMPTPEMFAQSQYSPSGNNYGNMQSASNNYGNIQPATAPPPYE